MTGFKKALIWCSFSVLMISCQDFFDKEIPIRLEDHSPLLVLNSFIENGQEELLFALTTSISMTDTSSHAVTLKNADFQLKINNQYVNEVLLDPIRDLYVSKSPVFSGDTVEIKVNSDLHPSIEAKTIIPKTAKVKNARFGAKTFDSNGFEVREIFFTVEDIKDEDNYFLLDLISFYEDGRNYSSNFWFRSPLRFFSRAEYRDFALAFNDTFFKNTSTELMIWLSESEFQNMLQISVNDKIEFFIRLYTVDKNFYDYVTQLYIHKQNRDASLFSGEPINVHSNIINGFGILSSFSRYDFLVDTDSVLD